MKEMLEVEKYIDKRPCNNYSLNPGALKESIIIKALIKYTYKNNLYNFILWEFRWRTA